MCFACCSALDLVLNWCGGQRVQAPVREKGVGGRLKGWWRREEGRGHWATVRHLSSSATRPSRLRPALPTRGGSIKRPHRPKPRVRIGFYRRIHWAQAALVRQPATPTNAQSMQQRTGVDFAEEDHEGCGGRQHQEDRPAHPGARPVAPVFLTFSLESKRVFFLSTTAVLTCTVLVHV